MTYPDNAPGRGLKSGLATTALVLGIFSCILCGALTGIPAIIVGIVALAKIRNAPAEYAGRGKAITGIVTGSLSILLTCLLVPLLILLPSLSRAREVARRVSDASHLRQIGMQLLIYSNDNMGAMPPHLAAIATDLRDPQVFISKASGTAPPSIPSSVADWHTLIPEIDGHCDFIYTGADLTSGPLGASPSELILVYTKDLYKGEGRNVAFADGHVEFVRTPSLASRFAAANTARASFHLPPLTLDGPPPEAGDALPEGAAGTEAPAPRTPAAEPTPPAPPPTPQTPLRTPTMTNAEALAALDSDDPGARRTALQFLRRSRVSTTEQPAVAARLQKEVNKAQSTADRRLVLDALNTWATADNVAFLTAFIDKADFKNRDSAQEAGIAIRILTHLRASSSAESIAKGFTSIYTRNSTAAAFRRFGPSAESAVLPYLHNPDEPTRRAAVSILKDVGTSSSIPALQELADDSSTTAITKSDALAAINAIRLRSK